MDEITNFLGLADQAVNEGVPVEVSISPTDIFYLCGGLFLAILFGILIANAIKNA